MMHIRVDSEIENSKREFACGIGPDLPEGDNYVDRAEISLHRMVDCPGCGGEKRELGTPLSQLSGQPGQPGYERFKDIARSWGYE